MGKKRYLEQKVCIYVKPVCFLSRVCRISQYDVEKKKKGFSVSQKHIFLTGKVQVGKSTIIRRLLSSEACGGKTLGGFRTVNLGRYVYIMGADQTISQCSEKNICGYRYMDRCNVDSYPEVFDGLGCRLLENTGRADIIVMDELGFLESEAFLFQRRILEILDGNTPVIGVIKPKRSEFLDRVREHPQVKVVEITPENRRERMKSICSSAEWMRPAEHGPDSYVPAEPQRYR